MSATRDPLSAWEPLAPEELLCGKYRIGHRLGAGAMGIVYHAEHVQLRLPVAIKVMRVELSGAWSGIERMLREARAAARLKSEHIVRVLDVGRLDDGLPFIVMEYLDGTDLAQVLQRAGKLSLYDAIEYVVQACDGVSEAHAEGIVHRDLKPENLFLTTRSDGTPLVKVFDFGVSKELGAHALRVTEVASAVGSPAYMSPEQMRAEEHVDARADIWALGVVLTELCTGHLPYSAQSLALLFEAVQSDQPRLPRSYEPDLPQEIDDIVRRCLRPNPEERFASAGELASELWEVLTQIPNPSRVLSRRVRTGSSTPYAPPLPAPALRNRRRMVALTAVVLVCSALMNLAVVGRRKHPATPLGSVTARVQVAQVATGAPSGQSPGQASTLPLRAVVDASAAEDPDKANDDSREVSVDAPQPEPKPPRLPRSSVSQRGPRPAEMVTAPESASGTGATVAPNATSEHRPSIAPLAPSETVDVLALDRVENERAADPTARQDVPLEPWDPESFGGRR